MSSRPMRERKLPGQDRDSSRGFVGVVSAELFFAGSNSLKDKRMYLRSIKQRLQRRHGATVAEVVSRTYGDVHGWFLLSLPPVPPSWNKISSVLGRLWIAEIGSGFRGKRKWWK